MQCNGLGFYDKDVPPGHPDFSRTFRCPNNPLEEDDQRQRVLRQMSNLDVLADKTFANFNPSAHHDSPSDALAMAQSTAQDYAENPSESWLVLAGTYGVGKTHLAAAVGNLRLKRGDTVLFLTAPDLLDMLRKSYGATDRSDDYNHTLERITQVDMLIIDDLGAENPSPWAKEKLFQMLDHRYSRRLPTVITTNVALERLDPRLHSRMSDVRFVSKVVIDAPDFRDPQRESSDVFSDLSMYSTYTFDAFDTTTRTYPDERDNLERVVRAAYSYAQTPEGWLVIIGQSGTGKTHLAAAVAQRVQAQRTVSFVDVSDLLDYLRNTYSPSSSVSFDEVFNRVRNAELLVLDNLSAFSHNKAWAVEKLMQIVNHRYLRRLPTLITTIDDISNMDTRIATRVKDRRLVRVLGINARPYVERTNEAGPRRGGGGGAW